jgi:succinate-semialdehyde dehydrogenase/glutarate-semialdehyde dehydrogenase
MSTLASLKKHLQDPSLLMTQCLINGDYVAGNKKLDVLSPSTGEVIASVPSLGEADTLRAIDAASRAFCSWKLRTAKERADILLRWYQLIVDHVDDLAAILTAEQGKPLLEAKGEILFTASFFEWFAGEIRRGYGRVIPSPDPTKRYVVLKQPVGVTAVITPWNFPAGMIGRKVAPALAAGCCVVIKPASQTPLTALALVALGERAGVPAGVVNVITGGASPIGGALMTSPNVAKLTFTGSTSVGKMLYEQAAPTLKHISLELGGNAPFIVFEDADIDAAVEGAVQAKFRNAGQTCVCANRILVHDSVYDQFVEKLVDAVAQLKIGDGFDPDTDIGPLVDKAALSGIQDFLDDALHLGAKIQAKPVLVPDQGCFMAPVVITDVSPDARVCHEEIFGPIAPILRFQTEDEAIAIANAGEEGLAGYFYTQNSSRVWRVAEAIECGLVGVNTGLMTTAETPFGGMKSSGLGREGGQEGLEAFLETKCVCVGGI